MSQRATRDTTASRARVPTAVAEVTTEAAASVVAAAASAPGADLRETVLGNCARCGSGARLKFCSRCQVVRYCSSDCQKNDVSG